MTRSVVSTEGFVLGPSTDVIFSWPSGVNSPDKNGSEPADWNATAGCCLTSGSCGSSNTVAFAALGVPCRRSDFGMTIRPFLKLSMKGTISALMYTAS
jgi:hypothetical protein